MTRPGHRPQGDDEARSALEERLRMVLAERTDGEREAEERARRVVAAAARQALAARSSVGAATLRARRRRLRPALALGAATLLVALAATPPGAAVSGWVRDGLGIDDAAERRDPDPALDSLPTGGRLLVSSPRGTWVVKPDGSRRLLGRYGESSWSPRGLFVAATRERQLVAATPEGEVRWALSRRRPVRTPRWSPSGLRIAFQDGIDLAMASGRGTHPTLLARGVGGAAPAWRPGSEDELAFVDSSGRVALVSAIAGRRLWAARPADPPLALTWSADGRTLVAVGRRALTPIRATGEALEIIEAGPGERFNAAAFSPTDERLAVLGQTPATSTISMHRIGRAGVAIFGAADPLEGVTWSPDGRWLLTGSPRADQWLFLRGRTPHTVIAKSDIAEQFDPGGPSGQRFPDVAGWCCPSSGDSAGP